MSEMTTLALAAADSLNRFVVTQSRAALAAFVMACALSLYAKQLAVFVLPGYLAMAVAWFGVRRLLRRDVVVAVIALGATVLPLVGMTLVAPGQAVKAPVFLPCCADASRQS